MDLVSGIAALAGARCTSFEHNRKGRKTTFKVVGPTSAMHDLITRSLVVGTPHRLLERTIRPMGKTDVEVTLVYLTAEAHVS